MLEIQWLRVMGRISKKLSFGGLEPLDSGLLVTYIVGVQVCRYASAHFAWDFENSHDSRHRPYGPYVHPRWGASTFLWVLLDG
jgi:hypothetical protein